MKIISTNIGEARTLFRNGVKVETGIFKFPVDHAIFLDSEDVESDHVIDRRYHGGKDKACYLYSANHYKYWQNLYPELEMPWGIFGENLTVEGLDEKEIRIGDVFHIGGATVQVSQPRQPCFKLEFRFGSREIVDQFINSEMPGIYVKILQKGFVKSGDNLILLESKNGISVHDVFELLYSSNPNKNQLNRAISDSNLAESCRRDLKKGLP